jgi:hypothetical protein
VGNRVRWSIAQAFPSLQVFATVHNNDCLPLVYVLPTLAWSIDSAQRLHLHMHAARHGMRLGRPGDAWQHTAEVHESVQIIDVLSLLEALERVNAC